ncbi:MAG TPA: hypothetical protein QF630_09025 [Alphaproteobacteria bacterium]|nr:hypothetical protein [Alphaproteobacteria bacterium]HJN61170.1 hypothetical protein [Alphaproteobacteria bacterium]
MNDAETAAATPQPSRVSDSERLSLRRWPSHEARLAPICTAGPSRPTEAPEPIEMVAPSAATTPCLSAIRPPLKTLASTTSATPCGRAPA